MWSWCIRRGCVNGSNGWYACNFMRRDVYGDLETAYLLPHFARKVAAAQRLLREGNSVEQTAQLIQHPAAFVEQCRKDME